MLKINKINNKISKDSLIIKGLKDIMINQISSSRYFSKTQKTIVGEIISECKFPENIYILNKDYFDLEYIENLDDLDNIKNIYYNLLKNIKTSLKNKNIFSSLQLRQIDVVLNNKKNIDIINNILQMYFSEFSKYVNQEDIKVFFENLSEKVYKKIGASVLDNNINNLFNDIYNKYNNYNIKNQSYNNNFKVKLLNKIENICFQEMYDSFINMYLLDKEKTLIDKININKNLKKIINKELDIYKKDKLEINKDLNNIIKNIVYSSLEKINNYFYNYNIKLDNHYNEIIFKNIVNKINKDKNIIEIINQEIKRHENKKVLKTDIYNFINNNIKYNKDIDYINKISELIDFEIIYLSDDIYKQDFIENKIKNINNFFDLDKSKNIYSYKKNYLIYKKLEFNKFNNINNKKDFISDYIYKSDGAYVSKIFKVLKSKEISNKNNNKNILNLKDFNFKFKSKQKLKLFLDKSEPIVVSVPKKIYDIVVDSAEIKTRSPFEGFEFLKMVHKKPGLKPETSGFLDSSNNNIFNKKSQTFEINNNNIKDINSYDRVDILNKKIIKNYDKVIEKAIDDKVNKNISDITDQVYNKLEKRLKSEQRRLGIS